MKDMRRTSPANENSVYFVGAGSAVVLALAYVIIIALYAPIGPPPINVDALLRYLGTNSTRWWWIIGLSVLTDFLFIPLTASLHFVLREVNGYLTWLAAACVTLFVLLDLAITWTSYTAAMALGSEYVKAVTEVQRATILATAEPVSAVLHSKILFVYNTLTLAAAILLTGVVMLRSAFGKAPAYLGIATGLTGTLAVVGSFVTNVLDSAIIVASCLTTLWVFIVGYRLFRQGINRCAVTHARP